MFYGARGFNLASSQKSRVFLLFVSRVGQFGGLITDHPPKLAKSTRGRRIWLSHLIGLVIADLQARKGITLPTRASPHSSLAVAFSPLEPRRGFVMKAIRRAFGGWSVINPPPFGGWSVINSPLEPRLPTRASPWLFNETYTRRLLYHST